MRRLPIRLCLFLVLLCALAGCFAPGRNARPTPTPSDDVSVPFETIATNKNTIPSELLGSALVLDSMPEVLRTESEPLLFERGAWLALITTMEDALPVQKYLVAEQKSALASLDYGHGVALILFTGGSRHMYIQRVGFRDNGLAVHVIAQEFTTGLPEVAYPSQIVRIRRADVPAELSPATKLTLTTTKQPMDP